MLYENEENSNKNKFLYNDEFISYINSLSDSIKEYFTVTSNVNKNKKIILNSLENELNSSINLPNNIFKNLNESISLLKLEINSDEKNLSLFFEDMKILFKKMKVKHQELKFNAMNVNNDNPKYSKTELDSLINKIKFLEKKISDDNELNQKLKDENIKLKKKYQLELSELSETNTKLSVNLIKRQKELVNIQKEVMDKAQEIENLKNSIKSKDNEEKKSLINSIKSIFEEDEKKNNYKSLNNLSESVNKIIENYKTENELLKIKQKDFEEKIKEVENINIGMNYKLNSLQEFYNKLMEENKQLIEEIAVKDIKFIKLLVENEKYKNEMDNLNNIKISSVILNENESNINDKFILLNKKLNKEKQEKNQLKEENDKLKIDIEKYKNKLLSLGVNYIAGEEVEISKNDIIDNLMDEIEQLKEKNKTLSEAVDSLISQFWNENNKQNDKK